MFGIMKPSNACGTTQDVYYTTQRQHYCGTCKAIGKQYGHSARMLLSYDTVFLAELTEQLSTQQADWEERLYTTNTCLTMPTEALPFSLEYAAAATMALSALKLDDQVKDSGKLRAKGLQYYFGSTFEKAFATLESYGVSKELIYTHVAEQETLEKSGILQRSIDKTILYYSTPTAHLTGLLFAQAAKNINADQNQMQKVGFLFGQLAYVLDAFEDYEKDVFNKEFNPIALHLPSVKNLSEGLLEDLRQQILALNKDLVDLLTELPIALVWQEQFSNRITSNLYLRLYKERSTPKTLKEVLQQRWQYAKESADKYVCKPDSFVQQLQFYIVVLAVFLNPQTSEYLPSAGKAEVLTWMGILTAGLAGLGIFVGKQKRERGKGKRRRKGRLRRRWKALKLAWKLRKLNKTGCFEVLFSECCGACCESCCESCCDSCYESCGDILSDAWDESPLKFLLVLFVMLLVLVGLIALIAIL
jgi:hypothetical protein